MKKIILLLSFCLTAVFAVAQPYNGTNISKYGGTTTTLGQKTMSASMPVVIGSDQSAISTTSNGTVFQFSPTTGGNSTVTQLAAAATFTGTVESVVNQQSYSILFFSDQNATITIKQFIDAGGTRLAQQLTFTYTASSQFARSGVMNGNYFQAIVQNTGGSTTTTLQLDIAYGTIPAATQLNNSPIAVNEINGTSIDANSGNKSAGTQRVTIATDDINLSAINTKTPALGQTTTSGSVPVTIASNQGNVPVLISNLGQKNQTAAIAVTLSNQNTQDSVVTGQAAQTATINNILTATAGAAATDVSGFGSCYVTVNSTGTAGGYIFEYSNDNSTWIPQPVMQASLTNGTVNQAAVVPSALNIEYIFTPLGRWIRLRISTTVTGGSIQAFSRFKQISFIPHVFSVGQNNPANLSMNVGQYGGTAVVNGGVAGIPAVGGNIAPGVVRTANPVAMAGNDIDGKIRLPLTDASGNQSVIGAGESIVTFSLFNAASAVTDGQNGRTIFITPKESDVYVSFSTIMTTTPTVQLEGSYDNVLFSIIPLYRIDISGTGNQWNSQAAFTPTQNGLYKGKTYGYPILRIHAVAGTGFDNGTVRVVPLPNETGVTVTPFGFTAANTTEAVGVANGQVFTGGVRTMSIPVKGSNKAILYVDGSSGTTGTNTIVLEGTLDGTIWQALTLIPASGGATVASVSFTSAATLPSGGIWETDISDYISVRARASAVMTTTPFIFGGLKIVPVPSNKGVTNNQSSSYMVTVAALAPTTATNLIVIEAGASKNLVVKRLIINTGTATASTMGLLTINRNSSVATAAGTVQSGAPTQRYPADPAFSGIIRTGAFTTTSVVSTASHATIALPTPISTGAFMPPIVYDFTNGGTERGFIVPAGVTNGVMFSHSGIVGAGGYSMTVEFSE
jgi:hypothetical protein